MTLVGDKFTGNEAHNYDHRTAIVIQVREKEGMELLQSVLGKATVSGSLTDIWLPRASQSVGWGEKERGNYKGAITKRLMTKY